MGFDTLFWLPYAVGLAALMFFVVGIGLLLRRPWAVEMKRDIKQRHDEEVDPDPQSRAGRSLLGVSWIDFSRLSRSDKLADQSGGHHGPDSGGGDGGGGD